jgi:ribosomal protein L37AE/L43A
MIAGALAVTAMLVLSIVTVARFVPRCPECGSLSVTTQWYGETIWICDSCQAVFRMG